MIKDNIKNLITSLVIKAVLRKAVAALPFLGLPVLNPILGWFVGWVFNLAYDELETGITFMIIDAETKAKADALTKASNELKNILKEFGENDEKTKKASEEFDRKLRDLIHLPI